MNVGNLNLDQLMELAFQDCEITPDEIPNIDLYMDQIITLFEAQLGGNRRKPEDKLLTKTMINNYSKEKLLRPIKGKTYTREHILQILLIYHLKQTLSIQDVKTVLAQGNTDGALTEVYQRHLAAKAQMREALPTAFSSFFQEDLLAGLSEKDQKLLMVLVLSSMGNYMKRMCETIIDQCYPDG